MGTFPSVPNKAPAGAQRYNLALQHLCSLGPAYPGTLSSHSFRQRVLKWDLTFYSSWPHLSLFFLLIFIYPLHLYILYIQHKNTSRFPSTALTSTLSALLHLNFYTWSSTSPTDSLAGFLWKRCFYYFSCFKQVVPQHHFWLDFLCFDIKPRRNGALFLIPSFGHF